MKNINQFDYPSREAQAFKSYSQNEVLDRFERDENRKAHFRDHLQNQKIIERQKVQQNQLKLQELQHKKVTAQKKIELERKKKQLEQIEFLKKQVEEERKKSYELAAMKEIEDEIKKEEAARRKKEFDENAAERFEVALKKMYSEKQENSFKDRLAEQRRRTIEQFQRTERAKAIKYKQNVEEKDKKADRQAKRLYEEQKRTLGVSAFGKNTDYSKSCLHNPRVIEEKRKRQESAFEKGQAECQTVQEKSDENRKQRQESLRVSRERGREALERMQREKEYEEYQKQAEEQQKQYNLSRIEAGKRNQFIGMKPSTLSQMEANKKLRSEEQFTEMFFKKPTTLTESFNQPAKIFEIVETRMGKKSQNSSVIVKSNTKTNKTAKSYLKQREESEIPCVSEGQYSFQDQQNRKSHFSSYHGREVNQNKSRSQEFVEENSNHETAENEQYQDGENLVKNSWNQTGIPYQKTALPREQSHGMPEREKVNPYQQQQDLGAEPEDSFNTDEMLKKYGLKASPSQKQKQEKSGKRKVVELANICENKSHAKKSKQELSYSESEEDSLM